MIQHIKLLRNIGTFGSNSTTASIALKRLVLLYGENGSGKTTLAAILRSLSTGEPLSIDERHRLGSKHDPHVVLECDTGPPTAVFQNGSWNHVLSNIRIFDDLFIDQNIYSGLDVGPKHRQQLHNLILGEKGVALQRRIADLVTRINQHNTELQVKANAISPHIQGEFDVDQFCGLPKLADVDGLLAQAERSLKAASNQESIQRASSFQTITLPGFDIPAIKDLLATDLPVLDKAAENSVLRHVQNLGSNGEGWIAAGVGHMDRNNGTNCPFCGQRTIGITLIDHYRAYFSDSYTALKQNVATMYDDIQRIHGDGAQIQFERAVATARASSAFWAQFCNIPAIELDTEVITRTWTMARDLIAAHLKSKRASPLEPLDLACTVLATLSDYNAHRDQIAGLNQSSNAANGIVDNVRRQAQITDTKPIIDKIETLKATKRRHSPQLDPLCADYLQEQECKTRTEAKRADARNALNEYRTNVFPKLQHKVNYYLQRFNAGFRIDSLKPTNIGSGSGSTCTFSLVIRDSYVAASQPSNTKAKPTFRNIMSAGDRNTLALALFFSSLDHDPRIAESIVVIDDPISSLDDHRSMTTVQEVRKLAKRTKQVFVLSHNKRFLCNIWDGTDRSECVPLCITPDTDESTITSWDIKRDAITEHDHRHNMLQSYADTGSNASRELARSIRLHLEGFLRVAFPDQFPPGRLLGRFISICHQNQGQPNEILSEGKIQDLEEINEYAKRFHHDTNPKWESAMFNDIELRGFVKRTLSFTRPTG